MAVYNLPSLEERVIISFLLNNNQIIVQSTSCCLMFVQHIVQHIVQCIRCSAIVAVVLECDGLLYTFAQARCFQFDHTESVLLSGDHA